MIVVIVAILLVLLFAGSIESNLREAFSGDWMRFEETPTERERLEMENEEFSWGHNVRNYREELHENGISKVISNNEIVWENDTMTESAKAGFRAANYDYERKNSDAL